MMTLRNLQEKNTATGKKQVLENIITNIYESNATELVVVGK